MTNLAESRSSQSRVDIDLGEINSRLLKLDAHKRVEWALSHLPGEHIVSSSFGAQSAVMLHLLTQIAPNIPVVLTDTGYLFPETYRFIDELTEKLKLNLKVYRANISPAWQEARYGQLWEKGVDGLSQYNNLNKVAPMRQALKDLNAGTWFAGLRRSQSDSRQSLSYVQMQGDQFKVHPIADYSNKALHNYLKKHDLPYHPLWEKGYVSIGDWHTTVALEEGMSEQDTRFFGLKRECGLHEFGDGDGI
uniref:phosphoadenylyl-sulfate reductase n=1 Tax=Ningiella ruwaisensis TaxID=2364274 RepID=UPI00109F7C7E|nr:phosphoadenylyl-sulfate reductase [Ningiella ruwaisensis]